MNTYDNSDSGIGTDDSDLDSCTPSEYEKYEIDFPSPIDNDEFRRQNRLHCAVDRTRKDDIYTKDLQEVMCPEDLQKHNLGPEDIKGLIIGNQVPTSLQFSNTW